jgi:hypothetical protein
MSLLHNTQNATLKPHLCYQKCGIEPSKVVLSAAGVLCGKKLKVAKWLRISAKWCSFGLAELVESSRENVMTFLRIARLSV